MTKPRASDLEPGRADALASRVLVEWTPGRWWICEERSTGYTPLCELPREWQVTWQPSLTATIRVPHDRVRREDRG